MSQKLWFSKKHPRKIILKTATLLVGKAPTKEKRIKMMFTMPLTGEKVTGFPEWLADARDYVMKQGDAVVQEPLKFIAHIVMSDDNLFQKKPIEAPKCTLKGFVVENMGSVDEPVTVLKFEARTPFATDVWRWLGQMGGEEFWSQYEIVASGDTDDDDEEEESEGGVIPGNARQLKLQKPN